MVLPSTRLIRVKVTRGEHLKYGRRHVIVTIILFIVTILVLAILLVLHGLYSA